MDREGGQNIALPDIEPVSQAGALEARPSTVLVTGASGFLGSAIAAALRARGHDVRVLVRPSSPRTNLNAADVVCEGDLRDRASLAAALKGVRFLFHAAADYRLWARNPEEIQRNNVEGTRLVMEEALSAGVERIVYTSSVATLKLTDGAASTEDNPLAERRGNRRLQAQQGRRRASGRGDDPARRAAGGDRQPVDADRSARRAADADRPHHRRGRIGAHAGLCRHRAQPRACRRRRCRTHRRARTRQDRRALHSWRRQRSSRRHAGRHRPAGRTAAAHGQAAADHALPNRLRSGGAGERFAASSRSSRWTACGWRAIICSSTIPRRGASSAMFRGPIVEGLADAIAWFRAHGHLK